MREYGQGRDNRDHEGEDEPDYPPAPRGRSTPRASRSPPRYEPGRDDREWEDVADDPPAPRGHTQVSVVNTREKVMTFLRYPRMQMR